MHPQRLVRRRLAQVELALRRRSALATSATEPQPSLKLSPRETESLHWIAQGKTYKDISVITGMAYGTIKTRLDVARLKLNAINMPHAVAKAITLGLIKVEFRERALCELESSLPLRVY